MIVSCRKSLSAPLLQSVFDEEGIFVPVIVALQHSENKAVTSTELMIVAGLLG